MKAYYETYRYTDEIRRLKAQSIVECRLSGSEINAVLAVQAKVTPTECGVTDGEVRYGGRLTLGIVYEDADKNICRAERGADFFHKAADPVLSPSCSARAILEAENISIRREGTGLYVSVIVGATLPVYGSAKIDYVSGGEDLISRKTGLTVWGLETAAAETEIEDEFDADYVGDILLHAENVLVTGAVADGGQVDLDGEMAVNICALKSDGGLCAYEKLIPFHIQIPCEAAFGNCPIAARVTVKSARVSAGTDEEKGRSKMALSALLSAECVLYKKDEILIVEDAYCTGQEITLKKQNATGRYLTNVTKHVERVSGSAAIDGEIDDTCILQAAVLPRAELVCKKNEQGEAYAEGVVQADVLYVCDGSHKKVTLSLPVEFPLRGEWKEQTTCEALAYGLNVKRRKNGEIEVEGTLKAVTSVYEKCGGEYISEIIEGEPFEEEGYGISVFLPREGEELWQVAKRLRCKPEDLQKSNPTLTFPVKKGERIVVCRGFGENLEK